MIKLFENLLLLSNSVRIIQETAGVWIYFLGDGPFISYLEV